LLKYRRDVRTLRNAKAAKFNSLLYLEIRGITDSADKLAPADFDKNLSIAMENIANLLIDILNTAEVGKLAPIAVVMLFCSTDFEA